MMAGFKEALVLVPLWCIAKGVVPERAPTLVKGSWKRQRGLSVIEPTADRLQASKRRLQLVDEDSDVFSAEATDGGLVAIYRVIQQSRVVVSRESWELLRHLRKGGVEAFLQYLLDCDLQDLGFSGELFTWCNHREFPAKVRERRDRACGDRQWIDRFPEATVSNLPIACSDYVALILKCDVETEEGILRSKPKYHFEEVWLLSEEFSEVAEMVKKGRSTEELFGGRRSFGDRGGKLYGLKKGTATLGTQALERYRRKMERHDNIQRVSICRMDPRYPIYCTPMTPLSFLKRQGGNAVYPGHSPIARGSVWTENEFSKSTIVFSKKTPFPMRMELVTRLGVPMVDKHDKYLDFPAGFGASKWAVVDGIKDHI
ncbi:hypothetical protein Sango_2487300 [Sesamum angolense]|uniref:Uncharacterized protein n=1 Tax=Sesamum angolense TaxID=2727404 RepID=A0AAE1W3Q6_9LAMI|nr:hypothetical protein Sango_2487300 [Sesamum angolense]